MALKMLMNGQSISQWVRRTNRAGCVSVIPLVGVHQAKWERRGSPWCGLGIILMTETWLTTQINCVKAYGQAKAVMQSFCRNTSLQQQKNLWLLAAVTFTESIFPQEWESGHQRDKGKTCIIGEKPLTQLLLYNKRRELEGKPLRDQWPSLSVQL